MYASHRRRYMLSAALLLLCAALLQGCSNNSDEEHALAALWAEATPNRSANGWDVSVYLGARDATPATVIVFIPVNTSCVTPDAANPLARLDCTHDALGFVLDTEFHASLDNATEQGCLAVAVYRPAGPAPLANGPLFHFSLTPSDGDADHSPLAPTLPVPQSPVYINGVPRFASAATADGVGIPVSAEATAPAPRCFFLRLLRRLPSPGCRAKAENYYQHPNP